MKGVCFQDIETIALLDLPDPELNSPTDAIVKVSLAGLCGSDLHPYFGRETGLDAGTVMGHEMVGRVVEVGDEVTQVDVGDLVFTPFSTSCGTCYYCRLGLTSRCVAAELFGWVAQGTGLHGCQSEYVRVPNANGTLLKCPEGLSPEAALLLGDNLSTGYFCADMAHAGEQETIAVIGCGTVGQLAILSSRVMGAKQIVAIDLVESRRSEAGRLGVETAHPDNALEVVNRLTDGRGADAVLELVGLPSAQKLAYELIRPGGTMSVIGCHCTPNFSFSPVDAYDKNLIYKTGRCPARHYMEKLVPQVLGGAFQITDVRLDEMISHRFAPADCVEAYHVFSERRNGCMKAVIEF